MQPHAVVAECAIAITASEACTAGAWPHAVQTSVSSFRNETIAPTLSTTQARNGPDIYWFSVNQFTGNSLIWPISL